MSGTASSSATAKSPGGNSSSPEHRDTLACTNPGMGGVVEQQLRDAGLEFMLEAKAIIHSYHQGGADELVHRTFCYTMLPGFFLFEAFKGNVISPVVPVKSFPTTLHRRLVEVAAKVVSHAGRTLLKITALVMESLLHFKKLRERCFRAPCFVWS